MNNWFFIYILFLRVLRLDARWPNWVLSPKLNISFMHYRARNFASKCILILPTLQVQKSSQMKGPISHPVVSQGLALNSRNESSVFPRSHPFAFAFAFTFAQTTTQTDIVHTWAIFSLLRVDTLHHFPECLSIRYSCWYFCFVLLLFFLKSRDKGKDVKRSRWKTT